MKDHQLPFTIPCFVDSDCDLFTQLDIRLTVYPDGTAFLFCVDYPNDHLNIQQIYQPTTHGNKSIEATFLDMKINVDLLVKNITPYTTMVKAKTDLFEIHAFFARRHL